MEGIQKQIKRNKRNKKIHLQKKKNSQIKSKKKKKKNYIFQLIG